MATGWLGCLEEPMPPLKKPKWQPPTWKKGSFETDTVSGKKLTKEGWVLGTLLGIWHDREESTWKLTALTIGVCIAKLAKVTDAKNVGQAVLDLFPDVLACTTSKTMYDAFLEWGKRWLVMCSRCKEYLDPSEFRPVTIFDLI